MWAVCASLYHICEIKPANVLITNYMGAKLSDFGTSRALENTYRDMFVGTSLFAAPEVMRNEPCDEKNDVYSFGLILLDMAVSGDLVEFFQIRWHADHPYHDHRAVNYKEVMNAVWHQGWRSVGSDDTGMGLPGAPPSVLALIMRCCAHIPLERPSFRELLGLLTGPCAAEIENEASYHLFTRFNPGNRSTTATGIGARNGSFASDTTTDAAMDADASRPAASNELNEPLLLKAAEEGL